MQSTPETNLWNAVLEQAIDDLTYKGQNKKYVRDRARAWLKAGLRIFANEMCDIPGCDPQI